MRTRLLRTMLAVSAVLTASAAGAGIRALTPQPAGIDPKRSGFHGDAWMRRHAEKVAAAKAGGSQVVFIGDSILHNVQWHPNVVTWRTYFPKGMPEPLNLGFAGDRTEHVLWRLENGELDGFEAKAVVLMIGTNNTGHFPFADEPPADTILGIRSCLDVIRRKQPKARVVLCAILPRGEGLTDPLTRRIQTVNREISRFCNGRDVVWCDATCELMTPDGRIPRRMMPDLLHPGAPGYAVFLNAVLPFVGPAVAECPPPFAGGKSAAWQDPTDADLALPPAAAPLSRFGESWWRDRLRERRDQIVESGGAFDLVFFGDSITHNWENAGASVLEGLRRTYSILDCGYGGDQTENLIWRTENGELEGYRAKCVTLMIGTNNFGKSSPEETAAGIRRIVATIRAKQPQAKLILMPIFPRGADPNGTVRKVNAEVDELIRPLADGQEVRWVDVGARLLAADGTFRPGTMQADGVHPAEGGYRIWADALLPYFRDICGK